MIFTIIKQKYNNKAKLLFTDTDSLTYQIETTVYQDFWNEKINSTTAVTLKIVNFMIKQIRRSLVNSKMRLLEFQSLNSSACECIHISKMIKIIKQQKESEKL